MRMSVEQVAEPVHPMLLRESAVITYVASDVCVRGCDGGNAVGKLWTPHFRFAFHACACMIRPSLDDPMTVSSDSLEP